MRMSSDAVLELERTHVPPALVSESNTRN